MPAIRKDLTADRGATFKVSVQYTDSNETPVNLTGYSAVLIIRDTNYDVVATLIGAVNAQGFISIKATDEQTALWPLGKTTYRLDLTDPSGDVDRLFFGVLNVRGDAA